MRQVPCILALLSCASLASAQLAEGQFIATVNVTPPAPAVSFGEIYLGDTALRTVTKLTIPQKLTDDRVNAVLMTTPATGFVSTIPTAVGVNGDIHAITLTGTTVTAVPLNLTPMPGTNIAQLHATTPTSV